MRKLRTCQPGAAVVDLRGLPGGRCGELTTDTAAEIAEDQMRYLGHRHRPAEQVALHLVAAQSPDEPSLLFRLDPLDVDLDAEGMAQSDDRADDLGRSSVVVGGSAKEAGVDLDLVEGELPQVAEARVARAEIVHDDVDAERLQLHK